MATPLAAPTPASTRDLWQPVARYGTLFVLVAMVVVFAIIDTESFATWDNVTNILDQASLAAVIAFGLTIVLAAGEFDLSIGYQTSLASVLSVGLMQRHGVGILPALLITVVAIAVIGLVNGILVAKLHINALVATLGIGTIVVGLNFAYTEGIPINLSDPTDFVELSLHSFLGLSLPVYVMALVGVVLWVMLNRTAAGHAIQAIGGNPEAARLSGIRVDRVRIAVYVIASLCCAVGGFFLASRTGGGSTTAGDGYLLSAFAAAFFGSAVMREGQFHILGTLVGVLTVSVAFNGMAISGMPTYYQYLFQGALLIAGVGVGVFARRRSQRG